MEVFHIILKAHLVASVDHLNYLRLDHIDNFQQPL